MFQKDDGTRKYSCFVCGRVYPEYEEYKAHILEKHEQGREYVLCPIVRCGAPVRDVRAHVKARHPTEKCPSTGQMKSIIWKDINPSGKAKTRKPSFRDGSVISIKNGGREMHYRSGLECEFYEILEAIPTVLKYDVEPFQVPYLFDGQQHKYNPDLSIQFTDGHVEIWEIKPGNQTDLPVNTAKWKAATQFCEARGLEFVVMTETGLAKLRKLAKRLND